jgi:hypothetical protein
VPAAEEACEPEKTHAKKSRNFSRSGQKKYELSHGGHAANAPPSTWSGFAIPVLLRDLA